MYGPWVSNDLGTPLLAGNWGSRRGHAAGGEVSGILSFFTFLKRPGVTSLLEVTSVPVVMSLPGPHFALGTRLHFH